MPACASTRTSRRWATRWKLPQSITLRYYVLDRPDPLGGELIEGPMLDSDRTNFVGYFPMPVRMGMTLGEMAQMFNAENKIGCDLHVIEMKDWRRADWFEDTGLPWVNPSPNLRSPTAEVLYPGIEILQSAGVAVGRGTDRPFEHFGAPWIDAAQLADYMNARFVPGVRFLPTRFTPTFGRAQGGRMPGRGNRGYRPRVGEFDADGIGNCRRRWRNFIRRIST